eukprot:927049_1
MAHKLFAEKDQCTLSQQELPNTLTCKAMSRIKMILNEFNDCNFMKKFESIFIDTCYTNTSLLKDFHHIKYAHHADDDDCEFANIFSYITGGIRTNCDGRKCQFITRYYRDRSKLQNDYILTNYDTNDDQYNPFDVQYMTDLISRIHVYFIHSYGINRFTLQELLTINEQIEADTESNIDEIEIQLLTDMMHKKKRNIIEFHSNNSKFNEHIVPNKQNVVDLIKISKMFKKHNVVMTTDELHAVLGTYTNKHYLIADLIDACYDPNDKASPLSNAISIHCSNIDHIQRQSIYKTILFGYFQKQDINNANFIKLAGKLLRKHYPHIDIAGFDQKAVNANINGAIFIKKAPEYKNSLKFARMFKRIKGYEKKHLIYLYVKINSAWIDTELDMKHDDWQLTPTRSNYASKSKLSIQHDAPKDVYEIGIQFYYWFSLRHHKRYIAAKHADLKTEMLNNTVRLLEISQWKALQTECKAHLDTDAVKNITSNGFWYHQYKVQKDIPFSIQHLCVLKLYTDYTTDSKLFCATLRSAKPQRITEIAIWCRLLSECVYCYGTPLDGKTPYYRGINSTFIFESMTTRFNLPMSTSRDLLQAVNFTEENGLVLALCKYGKSDLFKFDCDKLSSFSYEKETMFFGGGTGGSMLQIISIRQHIGKWRSYKQYMQPLNMISRMIHGLGAKKGKFHDNQNKVDDVIAYDLLEHTFYRHRTHFDLQIRQLDIPLYVDTLLKHYASTPKVVLNVTQLSNDYKWIHPLFMKSCASKVTQLLNVENIITIFNTSDEIVFIMPKEYILSTDECVSLIRASRMNSNVLIRFKWQTEMPMFNRIRIEDEYQKHLTAINWCVQFATHSMSFQKVHDIEADARFAHTLQEMDQTELSIRNTVIRRNPKLSDETLMKLPHLDYNSYRVIVNSKTNGEQN